MTDTAQPIDRLPPNNPEAEEAVLGSLLMDRDRLAAQVEVYRTALERLGSMEAFGMPGTLLSPELMGRIKFARAALSQTPAAAPYGSNASASGRQTHDLKTWPEPFDLMWDGLKAFEVRKDDRGYKVGDYLVLREWIPDTDEQYTGRRIEATVTCIVRDAWGLPPGLVVMGIRECRRVAAPEQEQGSDI